VDNNETIFPQYLVNELYSIPRFRFGDYITKIVVAIDPNCGTHNSRAKGGSDFALVSLFETNLFTVIAGAEGIDAHDPADYLSAVRAHIIKLRSFRQTANATIAVAIECDTGHEAAHIEDMLIGGPNPIQKIFFIKSPELKRGVHTNHAVKRSMAMKLKHNLQTDHMRIFEDFTCISNTTKDGKPNDVLGKVCIFLGSIEGSDAPQLKTQLHAYSEVKTAPTDPTGVVKVQFTGKKGGMRDDLAIALQLACYWGAAALSEARYVGNW